MTPYLDDIDLGRVEGNLRVEIVFDARFVGQENHANVIKSGI